jgi:hypothetical protein
MALATGVCGSHPHLTVPHRLPFMPSMHELLSLHRCPGICPSAQPGATHRTPVCLPCPLVPLPPPARTLPVPSNSGPKERPGRIPTGPNPQRRQARELCQRRLALPSHLERAARRSKGWHVATPAHALAAHETNVCRLPCCSRSEPARRHAQRNESQRTRINAPFAGKGGFGARRVPPRSPSNGFGAALWETAWSEG